MENLYDVVIIGAGPAGLAAGLYGARAKMKTLIIEKNKAGGQIVITDEVANYPGSIQDATGPSLIARMIEQCDEFGAERIKATVTSVEEDGKYKLVKTNDGDYKAKTVIVATGASPRKLGAPGEEELTGKGVSYCATCDASFFEDFEVFAIGGGDTAVEEAMFLTKFARKVTLVHRRDELRAAKSIQEKAFKNEKLEIMYNSVVKEVKGDGILESIVFENTQTGETHEVVAPEEDGTMGLFVFVGYIPATSTFDGFLNLTDGNYIDADETTKTNVPGVFAAGDCRAKALRQVVTATADGAIAITHAEKYISEHFE